MISKRVITLAIGLIIAVASYFFIISENSSTITGNWNYAINLLLAILFFAMMVSNQQFEENTLSKIERITSAFLFSFIILFQMTYVPLANYFFKTLITKSFFLSDILALFFFLLFLSLFIITFFVLNRFSRFGLLTEWVIFNNEKTFFILRSLWLAGIMISVYLYLKSPFLIID